MEGHANHSQVERCCCCQQLGGILWVGTILESQGAARLKASQGRHVQQAAGSEVALSKEQQRVSLKGQKASYKFYASDAFSSVLKLEKDEDRSERA
jgi:hypothetical protein